jgi:arylsulfatase A-like enzyme
MTAFQPFGRLARAKAAFFGFLLCACSGGKGHRPNVLLVTLDTTRPDYLSCYGNAANPTPGFDAIAADGVRFEHALSASALTPVSHASILTGKYPYHHGVRVLSADGGFRLRESEHTLAHTLREAGYRTLAVHSAFPVSSTFGFGRDFDVFDSLEGKMIQDKWDMLALQRRSDETTARALAAVDGSPEPFFLWVHYWDPHDAAFLPPPEYREDVAMDAAGKPVEDNPNRDRLYADEIRYMDAQFAGLISGLRERGRLDNTLVIVTADHGEGLADGEERHGWHAHRLVYQEQIHVPLLLQGPGIPKGRVVSELARTVDIVPTIEDYLGMEQDRGLDGSSLRDLVEGKPDAPRIAYADQINGYDRNSGLGKSRPEENFLYCIVDGKWKLIYRPHMPAASQLFDLDADPEERTNLAESHRADYLRLLEELGNRRPWVLEPLPVDPQGGADIGSKVEGFGYSGSDIVHEDWVWTCPAHPDFRQETAEPARHADCGRPLVPIARY